MISRADSDRTMSPRGGSQAARSLAIVVLVALAVFVLAFAADWRLPGLYMDAVNPEYIIPGVLDPSAPGHRPWILPGNAYHARFPVFTGSIYHGSTQLYFALPFMALLGTDIAALRIVQGLVGGLIVLLLALYAGRLNAGMKGALAAAAIVLLALDPSFVLALRTQAYSCMFPLFLLLGSILLLQDGRERAHPLLRLFVGGILFGLSVFSYFIFAFFLPALAWLLLRQPRNGGRLRSVAAWTTGAAIGYLPFAGGLFLLGRAVGGFKAMLHWLHHHGDALHVMGPNTGVFDRLLAVFTSGRAVLTGRWPWMMILQHHAGDPTGSLKAGLLIALPIVALFALRRSGATAKDPVKIPLLFVLSFLACAAVFGKRLDGHHYTAILPFLYVAFGGACAALWSFASDPPVADAAASRRRVVITSLVGLSVFAVGSINLINLVHFHRDLTETGGVGYYSDAIDRFAMHVAKHEPEATVYLPDWGYVMPFTFLTHARVAQIDSVDPVRMRREACAGKPQIVVFTGPANAAKIALVKQFARLSEPVITQWSQRDGKPVFQSARFAPQAGCTDEDETLASATDSATTPGDGPSIQVIPASESTCDFLSPAIATVRWDMKNPALSRAEIWIGPVGGDLQPWTTGKSQGQDRTGPWASPGMKFVLVDPVTQEHLAATEIHGIPCPIH